MAAELGHNEPAAAALPDAMHSSFSASSPSAPSSQPNAVEMNQAPPVNTQVTLTAVSAFLGITIGGLMLLGAELFQAASPLDSFSWETTR
ncbi:MAG: hypothetical protein GY924_07640 [Planctomycetaceae bacterium]|nr:hypothetical protein [Planctomycetaceae bacterium]